MAPGGAAKRSKKLDLRLRSRSGRVAKPAGNRAVRSQSGRRPVCLGHFPHRGETLGRCRRGSTSCGEDDRVLLNGCLRSESSQDSGLDVRLFFENSTGCLISQCQLWQYPGSSFRRWVGDSFGNFLLPGRFSKDFVGEFDPGSGRTLAACLTHASRAERPFGVLERRTGE